MSIDLVCPESEEGLLSVLLCEEAAIRVAHSLHLTHAHFAYERNVELFNAILSVFNSGKRVTMDNVLQALEADDEMALYVRSLEKVYLKAESVTYYTSILKDRAARRRLSEYLTNMSKMVHTEPDIDTVLESAKRGVYRSVDAYISNAFHGMKVGDFAKQDFNLAERKNVVPFSFPQVNKINRGRTEGSLTIWGAYTSDGKSSVAITEAIHAAKLGKKVGLVSLEMTDEEVRDKLISQISGVQLSAVDGTQVISIEDSALVDKAYDDLKKYNIILYCDPSIEPSDVESIQRREEFDLIIVDYLQRFEYREYRDIARTAKLFKNLALSTKCCIDLYSQVSPPDTKRGGNPFTKPNNNSLFGGKGASHEANNILYIWAERTQDEHDGWTKKTGAGLLSVSKMRMGKAGYDVPIRFDDKIIKWVER